MRRHRLRQSAGAPRCASPSAATMRPSQISAGGCRGDHARRCPLAGAAWMGCLSVRAGGEAPARTPRAAWREGRHLGRDDRPRVVDRGAHVEHAGSPPGAPRACSSWTWTAQSGPTASVCSCSNTARLPRGRSTTAPACGPARGGTCISPCRPGRRCRTPPAGSRRGWTCAATAAMSSPHPRGTHSGVRYVWIDPPRGGVADAPPVAPRPGRSSAADRTGRARAIEGPAHRGLGLRSGRRGRRARGAGAGAGGATERRAQPGRVQSSASSWPAGS